jgi:predicted transcriptional regulator
LKGLGQEAAASEVPETKRPAVPVRQSIKDDYLISLEDGRKFKSLKRHLMTEYGMTPEAYRSKALAQRLSDDRPCIFGQALRVSKKNRTRNRAH